MGKDSYLKSYIERTCFKIDDLKRKIWDIKQRLKDLESERDLLVKGLQATCSHDDFIQKEGSNERRCKICDLIEIAETMDSFKILNKNGMIVGPAKFNGTVLPFGVHITNIKIK